MTQDEILDELAERGLIDGNIVERLSAAHRRELEERERAIEHAIRHAEAVARDNCRDCIHNPNGKNYNPVGNAAAMRDALRALRDASRDFYNQILNSKYSEILDKYTCVKQGFPAVLDLRSAFQIANHALSAPARNCDLPLVVDGPADNNADKAWLVFKKHNPDAYFDVSGLLRCIDWLLAPAAERKGEGDDKSSTPV